MSFHANGTQPCIVDARVVFSRLGFCTVARLTSSFTVWLPRECRDVLREPRAFLEHPERLLSRVFGAPLRRLDQEAETEAIRRELALWERLPEDDELAGLRLSHLGDRADECLIPPAMDRGLRERFEQLRRGLDRRMLLSDYDLPRGETIASCHRDGAALAAALQGYGAFVLTRLEADGEGAPALCNYLDAWGVRTARAPNAGGPPGRALAAAVKASGLGPLSWSGMRLTLVHVLVASYPVLGNPPPCSDGRALADLWSQASVFWHPV